MTEGILKRERESGRVREGHSLPGVQSSRKITSALNSSKV